MSVKCSDIIKWMEELAPLSLAEEWDNPGLLVGDSQADVKRVLVALDATRGVIEEAVEKKADLIVTHHPILFRAVKRITKDSDIGKKLYLLIQNGIGVYSAHTNLDIAYGGTNDMLAELLGLNNVLLLDKTEGQRLKKLAVFVPVSHADVVREALLRAGCGRAGNYADCTFSQRGEGTFTPLAGAMPFTGETGKLSKVEEMKIETVIREELLLPALEAVKAAHPYEDPAFDVYTKEEEGEAYGIGRIGELDEETSFEAFARQVKEALGLRNIRIVGDLRQRVKKIALCTGSGIEYMEKAKAMGADVYITADIKFHDAQRALDLGIALIDATHYASEVLIVPVLCRYLEKKLAALGRNAEILPSQVDGQVFTDI